MKFLYTSNFKVFFFSFFLLLFVFNLQAQTSITNDALPSDATTEMTRAVNASNISNFVIRINDQLSEIRVLLNDSKKEKYFKEVIGPPIIIKSETLCPSIPIKRMILLSESFQVTSSTDFTHVKQAHNLLNIVLKELNSL